MFFFKKSRISIVFISAAFLVGCAAGETIGGGISPVVKDTDDFYGYVTITQNPVSAWNTGESFHLLGFSWREDDPNNVVMTAVVRRYRSLDMMEFRVGDEFIKAQSVGPTDFSGRRSYQRFLMPLSEFALLAEAEEVRMRVGGRSGYTVSTFSYDEDGRRSNLVAPRIRTFLSAVEEERERL